MKSSSNYFGKLCLLLLCETLFSFAALAQTQPRCNLHKFEVNAGDEGCQYAASSATCNFSSSISGRDSAALIPGETHSCFWNGSRCVGSVSCQDKPNFLAPYFSPRTTDYDFNVSYRRYLDGSSACVLKFDSIDPQPLFSAQNTPDITLSLNIRDAETDSALAQWNTLSRTLVRFTQLPPQTSSTSLEFVLGFNPQETLLIQHSKDAWCTASSGRAHDYEQLACFCPTTLMQYLKGYKNASYFGIVNAPNDLTRNCSACGAPGPQKPFAADKLIAKMPMGSLYNTMGDQPGNSIHMPDLDGTGYSDNQMRWCLANFEDVTFSAPITASQPTAKYIPTRTHPFSDPNEIELGVFESNYIIQQIDTAKKTLADLVEFNKQTTNAVQNEAFYNNLFQSYAGAALNAAKRLYQLRASSSFNRRILARFDDASSWVRVAALSYVKNEKIVDVDGQKLVPVFERLCPSPERCGRIDGSVSTTVSFNRLKMHFIEAQAIFEQEQKRILLDFPLLSDFARDVVPKLVDTQTVAPGDDVFVPAFKAATLSYLAIQKHDLLTQQVRLSELKKYLSCPSDKYLVSETDLKVALGGLPSLPNEALDFSDSSQAGIDARIQAMNRNYMRDLITARREVRDLVGYVDQTIVSTAEAAAMVLLGPGLIARVPQGVAAVLEIVAGSSATIVKNSPMLLRFISAARRSKILISGDKLVSTLFLKAAVYANDLASVGMLPMTLYNLHAAGCGELLSSKEEDLSAFYGCMDAARWALVNFYFMGSSVSNLGKKAGGEYLRPQSPPSVIRTIAMKAEEDLTRLYNRTSGKYVGKAALTPGADSANYSYTVEIEGRRFVMKPVMKKAPSNPFLAEYEAKNSVQAGVAANAYPAAERSGFLLLKRLGFGRHVKYTDYVRIEADVLNAFTNAYERQTLVGSLRPFIEGSAVAGEANVPEFVKLADYLIGEEDRYFRLKAMGNRLGGNNLPNAFAEKGTREVVLHDFGNAFNNSVNSDFVRSALGVQGNGVQALVRGGVDVGVAVSGKAQREIAYFMRELQDLSPEEIRTMLSFSSKASSEASLTALTSSEMQAFNNVAGTKYLSAEQIEGVIRRRDELLNAFRCVYGKAP